MIRRGSEEDRPHQRRRRGAAAVEMALVAPLFITLVIGMIESSRMGMAAQLLNTAAREGCRVAVISGKTPTDVRARVDAVLATSGIALKTFTLTPSNPATAAQGAPITLTLEVSYDNISWLPLPRFFKGRTLTAKATLSSERPSP